MAGDMAQRIFGEARRAVAQPVSVEVIGDDLLEHPDTVLPNLPDVVVTGFEFAPAQFLGAKGYGSRCGFGRALVPLTREAEVIPVDSAFALGMDRHHSLQSR